MKTKNKIIIFPNTPVMRLKRLNQTIQEAKKETYEQWMIRQNKNKPVLKIVK